MSRQTTVATNKIVCLLAFVLVGTALAAAGWLEFPASLPTTGLRNDAGLILETRGKENRSVVFFSDGNRHFEIQSSGTPHEMALRLPGGRVRSTGCQRESGLITEIADQPAFHRIEITACDGQSMERFTVRLRSLPQADERDRRGVEAERAFDAAERLRRAHPNERAAISQKYEEAISKWEEIGDRGGWIRTLLSLGETARDDGQNEQAIHAFEKALSLAARMPAQRGTALLGAASVYVRMKDKTALALEFSEEALKLARESRDSNAEAEALLGLSDVHYWTTELEIAATEARAAHDIWEKQRYRRGQARALWALATIETDLNDFPLAIREGQQALRLFESIGDAAGHARSTSFLGAVLSLIGRKQEALDAFEAARPILASVGDLESEAMVLNSMARIYAEIGNYDAALPFSRLAMDRFSSLKHGPSQALTLRATGYFYFLMGDMANARLFLEQALQAFQSLDHKLGQAFCWRDLGLVYLAQGDANKALKNLELARETSKARRDQRLESEVLLGLGRSRDVAGDLPGALELYHSAILLQQATNNPDGQVTTLFEMARSYFRHKDFSSAASASNDAIQLSERLGSMMAGSVRMYHFASARQLYDLLIDSLMHRAGAKASEEDAVLALELSDRARARGLRDSLLETQASITEGIDRSLDKLRQELQIQINADLESLNNPLLPFEEHEKRGDSLLRARARLDHVESQLRKKDPHYAALIQPPLLTVEQIQKQVVTDDTALAEYVLGDETSYVWVVTRDSFRGYSLPKRSEIEKRVREIHDLITARQASSNGDYLLRVSEADRKFKQAAVELSRILLGPIAKHLPKGRRLAVVADGALQYLPFGALATPESTPEVFTSLLVDHEIVHLPSASILVEMRREAAARRPPAKTVAIFADPVFDAMDRRVTGRQNKSKPVTIQALRSADGTSVPLLRLESTQKEARAIGKMAKSHGASMEATGFQATKKAVLDGDLGKYGILHFATHAILNDSYPEFSSLVLSQVNEQGQPQDGLLRLRDIYNMKLGAGLVVLSACDTALGKEIKGEGLMSMVRGFMYAGVPRVLASLWKVDDEATKDLMIEFYRGVFDKSLSPTAALREAQITMMKRKPTQAPYYWAGFQLQGDWKTLP